MADVLPVGKPHSRVHYPTGRVPVEAVIKLLADDYGVPCTQPEAVWRPVLAASEAAFREIAHHPSQRRHHKVYGPRGQSSLRTAHPRSTQER